MAVARLCVAATAGFDAGGVVRAVFAGAFDEDFAEDFAEDFNAALTGRRAAGRGVAEPDLADFCAAVLVAGLLAADLPEGVLFTAGLFAAGFLVDDFFAAGFLAGDFFAVSFSAGGFFAAGFLAGDLLAGGLSRTVCLAEAFFAAVLSRAGLLTARFSDAVFFRVAWPVALPAGLAAELFLTATFAPLARESPPLFAAETVARVVDARFLGVVFLGLKGYFQSTQEVVQAEWYANP